MIRGDRPAQFKIDEADLAKAIEEELMEQFSDASVDGIKLSLHQARWVANAICDRIHRASYQPSSGPNACGHIPG